MADTIATLNDFAEEFDITEARILYSNLAITKSALLIAQSHEFLRNGWRECRSNAVYFIQERRGCFSCTFLSSCGSSLTDLFFQWFSSGTEFSEYAEGGHYKMSKADKRENIIMV